MNKIGARCIFIRPACVWLRAFSSASMPTPVASPKRLQTRVRVLGRKPQKKTKAYKGRGVEGLGQEGVDFSSRPERNILSPRIHGRTPSSELYC